MNTRQALLLTALSAFAGGLLTGLLTAPSSGADARRGLRRKVQPSARWLGHQLHAVEAQLQALEHQLETLSHHVGDRVRTSTLEVYDKIVPSVPDAEDAWDLERTDLAHDLRHLPRK